VVAQQKARLLQWLGQLKSRLNMREARSFLTPTVLSVMVRGAAGPIRVHRFFTAFTILAIMQIKAFIWLFGEESSLITGGLETCPRLMV